MSSTPWPPPDKTQPVVTRVRTQAFGQRIGQVWSVLLVRNVQIARKGINAATQSARQQATNFSKSASSVNASKPLNNFMARSGEFGQRAGVAADRGLSRLEADLQKNDATVIITTLVLIVLCMALTALIIAASITR
jgi:hypothetical protein